MPDDSIRRTDLLRQVSDADLPVKLNAALVNVNRLIELTAQKADLLVELRGALTTARDIALYDPPAARRLLAGTPDVPRG